MNRQNTSPLLMRVYHKVDMPTFPNIERYYASLAELIEAGGSDNELNIRPAFQNCLAAYCAAHKEQDGAGTGAVHV